MKIRYFLLLPISVVLSCTTSPTESSIDDVNQSSETTEQVIADNSSNEENKIAEDLDAESFKLGLEETTVQLIDVRTPEEFGAGTIEGASNIDFLSADFETKIESLSKEQPVYLFCKSGGRSGQAKMILKEHGFKTIYNLIDGFSQWPY